STRLLVPALVALSVSAFAAPARALDCTTLSTPVYVTGSSAVKPILAQLAQILASGTTPITIVYRSQRSCTGVDAILNGTLVTGPGVSYWAKMGTEHNCDLTAPGVAADIGLSDVFADTCYPGTMLPITIRDFPGHIQTMTFTTSTLSSQNVISAEAAYFAFGF